ncbi:unnamed protein product [Symbiodinium natans]|uniref:Tr-type G domain-containing protein n=1 Tax=Symbiodinium natans TaxID=878477 RepID=A0A812UAP5_9DINO|nr:unnamed protein product [Symbiodinium natans]
MDSQKEEREKGQTMVCNSKEFFTERWHYTITDLPGRRNFIKNMVKGTSAADAAILMVPADDDFAAAIQGGSPQAGGEGQTRLHARLINLLGVKQLCVCVNKMDSDPANYAKERYDEVYDKTRRMLIRMGWKKPFVEKSVPMIPISGLQGDNLIAKSEKMAWWKGQDVTTSKKETCHVETLQQVLNDAFCVPPRPTDAPMRMPIQGLFKIKGVGDVVSGRVEQGLVKPGEEVVFLPSGASGSVFTVEMHHQRQDQAVPGDVVGLNIKGLDKSKMPKAGDVMIYKKDDTLKVVKQFDAQVQIMDLTQKAGQFKPGFVPTAVVKTAQSPCTVAAIRWKMGKETKGKNVCSACSVWLVLDP